MNLDQQNALAGRLRRSPTLARLTELAHEHARISLMVLLPGEGRVLLVMPHGTEAEYPEYCRLVHESKEGRERCKRCHALLAFGTCNRQLIMHRCHTDVNMLAACVEGFEGKESELVVISSCVFASGGRVDGWRRVRKALEGVPADFGRLRKAYWKLPVLSGRTLALAKACVRTAAAFVGELEVYENAARRTAGSGGQPEAVGRELAAALVVARDKRVRRPGQPAGALLTEMVKGVIGRHPEMAFSVREISRAAHMTPNHFSMLFAKHAGESFKDFIIGRRIEQAKKLLRNLAMNIHEVAYGCGFTDANYFARCFKAHTGKSPHEWRARL